MAGIVSLHLSSNSRLRTASLPFPSKLGCPMRLTRMPQNPRFPKIFAFTSNDIKVGSSVEVDGAPWRVLEFLHVKPGKGAAFVRTKMRNYVTGNIVEKTFRAGSTINEANVMKETKQYTYKDGSQYVFMDLTTYEEARLNEADIGNKKKWLKEGMDCNLLFWNGRWLKWIQASEETLLKVGQSQQLLRQVLLLMFLYL
ncbi:uncharacterized protein [Aristolochia californica]|uniref:uncharacterized protein isoform X2 n=1 Tax=Aristolochia californica TaxID=171875 RepID=UPI0035DE4B0A